MVAWGMATLGAGSEPWWRAAAARAMRPDVSPGQRTLVAWGCSVAGLLDSAGSLVRAVWPARAECDAASLGQLQQVTR